HRVALRNWHPPQCLGGNWVHRPFRQAVLNGVVMLSCFSDLRAEGVAPNDAVLKGATMRLRTVLMTTLLAMLGLLPMALSHSIGSEVQKPLAVVVIGGLVSATLLTLFVLPTLYYAVEQRLEERVSAGSPSVS